MPRCGFPTKKGQPCKKFCVHGMNRCQSHLYQNTLANSFGTPLPKRVLIIDLEEENYSFSCRGEEAVLKTNIKLLQNFFRSSEEEQKKLFPSLFTALGVN